MRERTTSEVRTLQRACGESLENEHRDPPEILDQSRTCISTSEMKSPNLTNTSSATRTSRRRPPPLALSWEKVEVVEYDQGRGGENWDRMEV